MEELKPIYNCGQDQLYGGIDLVIASFEEELASFTAFKPKYDAALVVSLKTELLAARNLPALEQRLAEQEVARVNLLGKLNTCLDSLNALRLYIRDAYSNADERDIRWKEAGFDDYQAASNANWEKLSSIMGKALAFINLHEPVLLAGDNMPPTFKASFTSLEITVQPDILVMQNLRENNKQGTSLKITANNNLFVKIMDLCEDGAYIFRKDSAKRSQFLWTSVLEIITPPGAAGMKGEVRDSVTNVLVEGAMVVLLPEGLPEIVKYTDAEGKYEFKNVPAADYLCKVDKLGYMTLSSNVTISTGVTSTKNFSLVLV